MIVYVSSFDVSRPDGPGVNEQLFILSMARLQGSGVLFIIPEPAGHLPLGFPLDRCQFLPGIRGRNPFLWLRHQWRKYWTLRKVTTGPGVRLLIIRPDVMPIAETLFTAGSRIPYCTKNAHVSAKARLRDGGMRGWFFRVHFLLLERLLRRATSVDVVSALHREELLSDVGLEPGRVTVTDNGVDMTLFVPQDKAAARRALGLEAFRPLVGYVGNLAFERGGSELIAALPLLVSQFPQAGALIVEGDGRSTSQLRELARETGMQDRVVFLGPIPLPLVARHIAALDVAVSFREDDGCSELKVRQYIACGRPVVASATVNAFIESARLGALVDRRDSEAISRALATWASAVATPELETEVAERLARYACEQLDTDIANRRRVQSWMEAVRRYGS